MAYIEFNMNPKKKLRQDCVVRAIARAEYTPYMTVLDSLYKIGRSLFTVPSDKVVYRRYLAQYPKVDAMKEVGGKKKRLTVEDVCKMDGTFVVSVRGHLTCVEDGDVYDTWNCSHKCAYEIWKVA